jgi:hypothetical protein
VSAAVCLVLAVALVLPAAAAAAGPEFTLHITQGAFAEGGSHPGFKEGPFHRGEFNDKLGGDIYRVTVTNIGDASTSGSIILTGILAAGLTLGGEHGQLCDEGEGTAADPLICGFTQLSPGQSAFQDVPVNVAKDAPDTVTSTFTVTGGGAAGTSVSDSTPVLDPVPFGAKSFTAATTDEAEADYPLAGGHPFRNRARFDLTLKDKGSSVEFLKDASVDPPLGFLGNPAATARCPVADIPALPEVVAGSICPLGSKIGFATIEGGLYAPIYNVKPDRGYPAQFVFDVANTTVKISLYVTSRPRTESYGLTVGATDANRVLANDIVTNFCGYGVQGVGGTNEVPLSCKDPAGFDASPFLSNPVDCSDASPTWKLTLDSWEHIGARNPITGLPDLSDPNWKTATTPASPVTECDNPALTAQFDPSIATRPLQPGGGAVQADQPSGLAVDFDFPQSNDPTDPANTTFDASLPQAPEPKDIIVKLPAGLSVSPSSADGLGACSDQASDPAGDQVHYDNVKPVSCPDSSKIGTAVATSPLLALREPEEDAKVIGPEPIPGDVYLLAPHPGDLPTGGGEQGGKFRLLIVLENAERGINFKLPGIATADPQTGQLTATFTENPQLPASHITVSLKEGPRAPLATPVTCGSFTTASDLIPWSTPGTPEANPSASFDVGAGANGKPCPANAGARPFAPTMSAGTESSAAGQSSPLNLHIARNDGEGELSSLEATLPKGLAAKFVGIPYCSEMALAAAAARTGKAEQANPSCPASRIGSVTVGAGPGPNPFYAGGTAYLAGPYKGAPMSVAVITPAVAGPFDLGTVVSRNALYINPETAQGHVVSDPLPTIIDGVPLRLRSIDVNLDRPSFTLNPTNCSPLAIDAKITSTDGATANPTNRFQASNCGALGFKPNLKLSLKGGTKRSEHPALKATLTYPKGNYANIAKAVVSLPHSEFLAQNHIKTICTRVQFAADQCPNGSIYGFVKATTPLLDKPLEGPLYLRSSSHPLPDLVAALHGQIDVDLVGRIDSKNGGIRTTFDAVPDAPVTKFTLTMQGGKKGLLENSRNLCATTNKADVKFTAQNGKTANSTPVLTNSCKRKHGKGKGGKAKGNRRTIAWLPSLGF